MPAGDRLSNCSLFAVPLGVVGNLWSVSVALLGYILYYCAVMQPSAIVPISLIYDKLLNDDLF